jgi:Carboxypeptidase regulatory-like domain
LGNQGQWNPKDRTESYVRWCAGRSTIHLLLLLFLLSVTSALALGQDATISGQLVDSTGAAVENAQVKLWVDRGGEVQQTRSTAQGEFLFAKVAPGTFYLTITADGFAVKTIAGELHLGEALALPPAELALATITTEVNVTQTQEEIAEEQLKQAETQRLVGLIPNFFVNYNPNAVPLNTRQKFQLTWKTMLDPSTFVINGMTAGVSQAQNTNKGFGQGAEGYAKRYGAAYADFATSLLLEKVALSTVFKQDPRYFYKGTGSNRSRFFYAVSRSVICQGDNRKAQFCYSSVISEVASDFITNYYYPAQDRNSNAEVLQSAAIGIGVDSAVNVLQEFILRKFTHEKH